MPKKIKPGDAVVVVLTLGAAVASLLMVAGAAAGNAGSVAIVEVNGREVRRVELSDGGAARRLEVQGYRGKSTVEIEGRSVWMLRSSCRDKLCVGMGKVDSAGQSIICLPNRVVIRIEGEREPDSVDAVTE
jgi:hypothetical protein